MSFRIKSVVTNSRYSDFRRTTPTPLSGVLLNFFDLPFDDDRNFFTIILGKNAIGKSQLLSDIAEAFCIKSGEFTSRRSSALSISITTLRDSEAVEFSIGDAESKLQQSRSPNNIPSCVVASATTPFDKFRLSRDVIRERVVYQEDEDWQRNQYYFYSGLRDSNGRTNFRSAILRTIRGIFLNPSINSDRLVKVRRIFDFLGLHPSVQVGYSLGGMSWSYNFINKVLSEESLDEILSKEKGSISFRRLINFIETNPENEMKIRSAIKKIAEKSTRPAIGTLEIEIGHGNDSIEMLSDLFLLKDLRLLTFREVSLRRAKGQHAMDILDASSGEISIISGILGIAAGIKDNSLVLIDEPEISLHPEWQDRYLELVRDTFSVFKGCHFVIATHSPIILSDAKIDDTKILNLSHLLDGGYSENRMIARSYDEIVATQFGVVDDENLYVKQEVVKAVSAIARGEVETSEFKKRIDLLLRFKDSLSPDSKVSKIIIDALAALK